MTINQNKLDSMLMETAINIAKRGTCDRKHVGALIVDKTYGYIIATGWNTSIDGSPTCDTLGHMMENNHCVRTIHAEVNALLSARRLLFPVLKGIIYTTASPCWKCFQMIAQSGIKRIVYKEFYRDDRIFDAAKELGIELDQLQETE